MKKFIKKITYFIVLPLLLLATLFLISNKVIKKRASFKVKDDINKLIVGHSHSECAFNDSLIDKTINFSNSGESYFYTYAKVKQLIHHNSNIKTVFLEFSNNAITDRMNDWIWGDIYMTERLSTYLPFLEEEDISLLYKNNKRTFIKASMKTFKNNIFKIITSNYDYTNKIGKYNRLEGSKIDSLLIAYKKDPQEDMNALNFSNENLIYLEKTVEFLNNKAIDVYFVRSPQHKYYIDYQNEEYFLKFKDSVFSHVEFLDFNDFPADNVEQRDFGHLNNLGAEKFSIWFNKLLENGLLSTSDIEEFIKENMNSIAN